MLPIFIVGPTGIGKTELAIRVAKEIKAEIISADSVQVFKLLDIGTGKPSPEELQGVKMHLCDFVSPNAYYSAYNYSLDVKEALKKIDGPCIISGGTGLFVEALIGGIAPDLPRDEKLRLEIRQKAKESSWEEVHAMVKDVDPEYASRISSNDPVRISRTLEIYFLTGKTLSSLKEESFNNRVFSDYKLINLTCAREDLYQRIERRIDNWFEQGWVDQVNELFEKKIVDDSTKALGFKEIIEFLRGDIKTRAELFAKVKQKERNYAKRQITWFKRYEERIDIGLTFDVKSDTINILDEIGE
ncbi:tRNA (adenosine(37)-N6)-dimethylallyltransferase MiaA [Candidatus Calescamantes bacterium]|nr:tRNA (adenosine(37)-N6)-dimethylallyltransferase MiaA [Candidatus Calescamantes bacterium]